MSKVSGLVFFFSLGEENAVLLGDVLYGASQGYIGRHALHAFGLELIHPTTNKAMQFRAELPEDLKQAIRQVNLDFKEEWM